MRAFHIPAILGFSAVVFLQATSAQAITLRFDDYDFNKLKFIKQRPIESNTYLDLRGLAADNQGFVAFYNQDPNALDRGHRQISLNSRRDFFINNAPYYGTGRPTSPEEPATSATRAASLFGSSGFTNFSNFLTTNGIQMSDIGFSFGLKKGRDFTKTWNLGSDTLGTDWFGDPNSSLEERIYRANPDDVELGLYNGTTKIIDIGYTNFNAFVDYGTKLEFDDDIETNFTDPVEVKKARGLSSFNDALAEAFLKDVYASGNRVQLINSFDGAAPVVTSGNGYDIFLLPFPVQIRVVRPIPESSLTWALLTFGALVAMQARKKRNRSIKL